MISFEVNEFIERIDEMIRMVVEEGKTSREQNKVRSSPAWSQFANRHNPESE